MCIGTAELTCLLSYTLLTSYLKTFQALATMPTGKKRLDKNHCPNTTNLIGIIHGNYSHVSSFMKQYDLTSFILKVPFTERVCDWVLWDRLRVLGSQEWATMSGSYTALMLMLCLLTQKSLKWGNYAEWFHNKCVMFITVFQHIKKTTLAFRGLHFKIKTKVSHMILYYFYYLLLVRLQNH